MLFLISIFLLCVVWVVVALTFFRHHIPTPEDSCDVCDPPGSEV